MRIAFISFEYPPDIAQGGISTYNFQIARIMKDKGHDIEVFCGSFTRDISEEYNNVLTHRTKVADVVDFRNKVVGAFSKRHEIKPFDLFESPEINGNGYLIKKKFPELPLVVKLHMPAVLQIRLLNYYTPLLNKIRFTVSNLVKKGKLDLGHWSKKDKNQYVDIDYLITEQANLITAPSLAMKNWAIEFWGINGERIQVVPYPYIPEKRYLDIPLKFENRRITFIGKLNVHKGMVVYTKVIKLVLKKFPSYKFRFVANDGPSHLKGITMQAFMMKELSDYRDNLEFIGSVPLTEIPNHLELSDICVFPSIWECFGLVVCEAMAAGRPVIVSNNGGMKEIVENGKTGIVVDPLNARIIAYSILSLIINKDYTLQLGTNGRKSIMEKYNIERIGILNEQVYHSLLQNKTI